MTGQQIAEAIEAQAAVSRRGRKLKDRIETRKAVAEIMPELVARIAAAPIVVRSMTEVR